MAITSCFFKRFLFGALFIICSSVKAQELFPMSEPASTIPKGVFGIRTTGHFHYAKRGHREMLRLMYGLTANISTMITTSASNFHIEDFPGDLNAYYKVYHNHQSSQNVYPYNFEGVDVYTKWRFLNFDKKNEHLRFALYNEVSYNKVTHLDGFPSLQGDNSGIALGLLTTKLYRKLAISLASGYTKFFAYKKNTGGEEIKFTPGNSVDLNLSLGYLLHPRKYTSYKNLNINLYLEFLNKFYSETSISRDNIFINTDRFEYLKNGNLGFVCPGIQFIINSKTRIDLVSQHVIYHKNNISQYAMFRIQFQRYFL